MVRDELSTSTVGPYSVGVRRKEHELPFTPINILQDPRVVRGNTHSLRRAILSGMPLSGAPPSSKPQKTSKRRLEKRPSNMWKGHNIYDVRVEDPLRVDLDYQQFLVEQRPEVPPVNQMCQTDAFKPRPLTPEYVPKKTGVNATTAVQEDLFNFESEVVPLLEVLVAKTIEQAVLEVEQEEELACIATAMDQQHEMQTLEAAAVTNLEGETVKAQVAKDKILHRERARVARETRVRDKVNALHLSRALLPEVFEDVYRELEATQTWRPPMHDDIRNNFIPWVQNAEQRTVRSIMVAEAALDDVVSSVYPKQKAAQDAARARSK